MDRSNPTSGESLVVMTLRARSGNRVPFTVRIATTGKPLTPLARDEIFNAEFLRSVWVSGIPALAGQRFAYLVRQLANFAGGERDSGSMHAVVSQEELREPQTWVDIAAYLNRVPLSSRPQTGDGARLALGRGIFHEQCATCHRGDARGDSDGFVPSLRNQHYHYLVNQLHKLGAGYRHNVDENLVRFWGSFDDQDIRATADYLSRLRGPGAVHKVMRNDGVVVD